MTVHGCRVGAARRIYLGEIVEPEEVHALARRRTIGPQYPGEAVQSTPDTVAADPPYVMRRPVVAGVAMTPETVTNALRVSELGYMSRWADLLSECREKVPHLQAVLSTREQVVSGCDWEVTPKEHGTRERKNARAAKISDYVTRRLREIPNFGDAIQSLQGAVYHGRAGLEIQWKRDPDGLGVEALHPIHPKRLSFAASWRVHLWDENGNEYNSELSKFPGIDLIAAYPDKFVIHTPQTMGGEIPTRQGLGRVLVWYALFWTWSQRDWMRFAELFGQPWRIAFYEKGKADQDDIRTVQQALRMMSVATTAVLPSTTKFDLKMPTARSPVHESLRNALNAEISKVVLGQTLTTDASPNGKSGSQALGSVHENVLNDVVKRNDGRAISETIQRFLIEPIVRRQFGVAAARQYMPQFSLITEDAEDINSEWARTKDLIDRGCPIDVDDAREHFTTLPAPEKMEIGSILFPLGTVSKLAPVLPIDPENPPALPAPAPPPGSDGGELEDDEEDDEEQDDDEDAPPPKGKGDHPEDDGGDDGSDGDASGGGDED